MAERINVNRVTRTIAGISAPFAVIEGSAGSTDFDTLVFLAMCKFPETALYCSSGMKCATGCVAVAIRCERLLSQAETGEGASAKSFQPACQRSAVDLLKGKPGRGSCLLEWLRRFFPNSETTWLSSVGFVVGSVENYEC